ncbi:MAG TPA: hypothetical protein VEX86_06605 [Longimicrobium sp.]|nr:hypothetical protein [Longimicrobium sp.]
MRVLLLVDNEVTLEVARSLLTHFIPEVQIEHHSPSKVVSTSDAFSIIDKRYDVVMLPLSLPNYNSLRIAEYANLIESPTRLVLSSGTDANHRSLQVLYDEGVELSSASLMKMVKKIGEPRRVRPDAQAFEQALASVLATATCFRVRENPRDHHDPGRPANLQDYRKGAPPLLPEPPVPVSANDPGRPANLQDYRKGAPPVLPEQPVSAGANNPWLSGSFYLTAATVIIALLAGVSRVISPWVIPAVLVGGILMLSVVGAMQLKNDRQLSDAGFLTLMGEALKRLPLLAKNPPR